MNTPFKLLQDDWIQIATLGDYPHEMGLQRIDGAAIANMTNRFNGFLSRLGRMFAGRPVYNGHHDTNPDTYPDGKSYGWIMELDNRANDGLWGKVKWTEEGRALVANGAFKFVSPVWNAVEIGRQNGRPIYRPDALISLALTNNPNLPLPPLANEQEPMNKLTEILGVQPDATADQIVAAAEALRTNQQTLTNTAQSEKKRADAEKARADAAQGKLIEIALANAITAGKITLAEKPTWQADLEKDFEGASVKLTNKAPALNTDSKTKNLDNSGRFQTEATRRAQLLGLIQEKQAKGLTYDEAWQLVKRENAPLFELMEKR